MKSCHVIVASWLMLVGGIAPSCAENVAGSATPLTAAQEGRLKPRDTFRECDNCPEMVVVPAGSFTMGSRHTEEEGPQHTVTISRPFAVGKLHVTVDQFEAFVRETGRDMSKRGCAWRNPGFTQDGTHPVVCVNWDDAKAYADWLANKTGKRYHLLSEGEWEYAARGRTSPGSYPRFWFGENEKDLCRYGNFADQEYDKVVLASGGKEGSCNDGYAHTSPAGHYAPNGFGLYDMSGNAWQWTADCWHDSYSGAPADGSAWTDGPAWTSEDCGRVVRGGSFSSGPRGLRVAFRDNLSVEHSSIGFRVARAIIH